MIFDDDDEKPMAAEPFVDGKGMPYCKFHFTRMKSVKSYDTSTKYMCRVPGCKEQKYVGRTKHRVPDEPQECPNCSTETEKVSCVVKEIRRFKVAFRCPNRCGFRLQIDRPDIELQIKKYEREQLAKNRFS